MTPASNDSTAACHVRRSGLQTFARRFRCRSALAAGLLLASVAGARPANAAPTTGGTWTVAPTNPGVGQAFGLWLLTDGTVLSHGQALNNWVILTPDAKGSYANGTWKAVASSVHARGGAQQHVLNDGRFFQAGGEYIDGPDCTTALCPTTEIYDPVANTWTPEATAPYDIGDTGSATLADGRILDSTRSGNEIQIYDPVANKWSTPGTSPLQSGDENSWASLQNGGVLAVGYQTDGAAIYDPSTGKWIRTGPVPSGFNTGDTGGISQMFDGRVFVYGLAGASYIYTPGATPSDPGTWALGPKMINGDEAEDEFSDTLPNGEVWGGLVTMTYGPGVVLQQFDPTTNTVSMATPPPDKGNPYPIGYVNLPNGQVMVTAADADWIYTPATQPQDEWRPTVTSVVANSDGSYTLTGTQISGLINGADEGDDMTMAENYPIVWLTDEAGNVYYCRSFAFSNMMPSKGPAPETCQFTTPKNLPEGTYNLYVSAVGVQSKTAVTFTPGVGGMVSADAGASAADAGDSGDDSSTGTGATTHTGEGSSSSSGATGDDGTGSSTDGGGARGAAGAGGDGASSTGTPPSSGCGCRAADESSRRGAAGLLVAFGLVLAGRRRRRARRA
jgi:MYXO-CTERM domain-containing protein